MDDGQAAGEEQPGLERPQRRGRGQALNISERQRGLGTGCWGWVEGEAGRGWGVGEERDLAGEPGLGKG